MDIIQDYITIYEFTPKSSDLFHLIGLLIFVIAGFTFAIYTNLSDEKYSLFRQFKIFFGYLLGGIPLIMLIVMIINAPGIISTERELKEIMENKDFIEVQGEIENFAHRYESDQIFESFTVNGVKFEYSDHIDVHGFHQTSENGGPIRENGQQFRISYIERDNANLILKLEIKR